MDFFFVICVSMERRIPLELVLGGVRIVAFSISSPKQTH